MNPILTLVFTVFNINNTGHCQSSNNTDSIHVIINNYNDSVSHAKESGNTILQSKYHLDFGDFYFNENQYGEGHFQYLNYIEVSKVLNDKDKLILAYRKVGYRYTAKYLYDAAIDFYSKALELSIEQNNVTTGLIYSDIGGVYYNQHNYDMAKDYYQKSLDVYLSINSREHLAAQYNNLGEICRLKEDYVDALKLYQKAILLNSEFNHELYLGINYENIATIYLAQNQLDSAYSNFLKSLTLYSKINELDLVASSYTNLGNYYNKKSDHKTALNHFFKALELNINNNQKINLYAYLGLYETYAVLGDAKLELQFYKKYTATKNSIFDTEKYKAVADVQAKFEIEQKELEIQSLEQTAIFELQDKKQQRTNLFIVIGLLTLILGLVIFSYLTKSKTLKQKNLILEQNSKLNKLESEKTEIDNKLLQAENNDLKTQKEINTLKRNKLKSDLDHSARELSTTALHVIGKNEILSNIKTSIQTSLDSGDTQDLNNLIKEIDYNLNLDKDWQSFKLHFEKVHQGFFTRLKSNYSNLTVDELKLCAYLRINLSSKEIGQILNITQVAINKRRNRLRKKLNLLAEDDLFDFMNNV